MGMKLSRGQGDRDRWLLYRFGVEKVVAVTERRRCILRGCAREEGKEREVSLGVKEM